jgi:hypothetical protein
MDDDNDVERPRRPARSWQRIRRGRVGWDSGVGVYVSPNSGLDAYGDFLNGVSNYMRRRCRSRQVLILGDFNARSSQWGNTRTNARGRMLSNWAAGLGLLLTNRGSTSTCVAWRGLETDTQLESG